MYGHFLKILILFNLIVFASCESEYINPYVNTKVDVLVVQASITSENIHQKVTLSKIGKSHTDKQEKVSGAFIAVISKDSTFYYQEDSLEKGNYYSQHKYMGLGENLYTLHIEIDSITYTAREIMPAIQKSDTIIFDYHKDKKLYSIKYVCEEFVNQNPAIYEIYLDWSMVEGYQNLPENKTSALLKYYSLTTIDIAQIFKSQSQEIYFPLNTKVIRKKYSITKSYESFLRSLLAETTWTGTYFDEAHGNISGNIDNGAVGYFNVSSVLIDTLYVR